MDKKLSDDALTRNDGEAGLAAARGTGNGGGSGKITGVATTSSRPSTSALRPHVSKRKMSKAERKRLAKLKMNGGVAAVKAASAPDAIPGSASASGSVSTFRDESNYISMQPADAATEQGYAVTKAHSTLEDAMLDLNPDNSEDLYKQQRKVLHWDRKKKKYIKLGMNEIDGVTGRRKKTDHGASGSKKKKVTLQKQYNKWADKSKRKIARAGAPEENSSKGDFEVRADWRNGYRSANKKTISHGLKHTFQESARSMRQQVQAEARRSKGGVSKKGKSGRGPRAELRSEVDMRRIQKKKEKRQMAARGIRPHKKLKPNQSRPSKQKIQFRNLYGTASGTGGKGKRKRR